MDTITKALARTKRASDAIDLNLFKSPASVDGRLPEMRAPMPDAESDLLSLHRLRSQHLVAFDSGDPVTRLYDMLRNQLVSLGIGPKKPVVAVAAPTRGCGTTITAVNLALSFARMPGANVLLVDANVGSNAIGRLMGLRAIHAPDGTMGAPAAGLRRVGVGSSHLHILSIPAAERPSGGVATEETFRVEEMIDQARERLRPSVVIVDLPAMLTNDGSAALVQHADAVTLVLATRETKLSDIEVCKTYIGAGKATMFVLNKCGKHGF